MKNGRTGAEQDPYHAKNGVNVRHLRVEMRSQLLRA
jgi:hypothetical protein